MMKTIKVDRYRIKKSALAAALSVLQNGGVVVFPTETAYGLAVDPRSRIAVEKIYRLKGRAEEKKLPLVAASMTQVKRFFLLDRKVLYLVNRHWPGPLTVVLPMKKPIGDRTENAKKSRALTPAEDVAVRVSAAAWARALPAALGFPVTATSANRSGEPPGYTPTAVRRAFSRRESPGLFLDAGRLPSRPPSTVIKLEKGKLKVLRQGAIRVN